MPTDVLKSHSAKRMRQRIKLENNMYGIFPAGQKMFRLCGLFLLFTISACHSGSWNHPYRNRSKTDNTYYSSFSALPKTLDPSRAYSSDEYLFLSQIVEPPLQYAYLKRPYQLEPLTLTKLPSVVYLDKNHQITTAENAIAFTRYALTLKPNIRYAPHPAFTAHPEKDLQTHLAEILAPLDFPQQGTRALTADDYVYAIKRLADPKIHSPIYPMMEQWIVGLKDLHDTIARYRALHPDQTFVDLRHFSLSGVHAENPHTFSIEIHGHYPQFRYWLAMPFFAPLPWEVDKLYSEPDLKAKNIDWDTFPVGTGPYLLKAYDPNRSIELVKNPNFHSEHYPTTSAASFNTFSGKSLPFIHTLYFSLEKESIPRWHKFLQGYYDQSGISSDSFDKAIQLSATGATVTPAMQVQGIRLTTTVSPSIYYMGFNMKNPLVGGLSEKARALRQAIAIAINYEDYLAIFLNGRGLVAQTLIPPGIFGHLDGKAGINLSVYNWQKNHAVRKPLSEAKRLLAEAGYPDGINPETHQPLILHYDTASAHSPDDAAHLNWMRQQFQKLGIQLDIRATTYNRFQEKMRTGQTEIFSWGWNADYPDPENFLFLLYGPNSKMTSGGENACNYENPAYDALYQKMLALPNSTERLTIIEQMIHLLQKDGPMIFGFFPKSYVLTHNWVGAFKPNEMSRNTFKYLSIDPALRAKMREKWNQPVLWPMYWILGGLILLLLPAVGTYLYREYVVRG